MANLIMTFITVLTVPLALLNFSSGIIGAGWLFFVYGEWYAPLYAFIVSLVAPFALSFPLMLSLIFAIPAIYLIKKGFFGKVIGFPFLVLSGLVTWSERVRTAFDLKVWHLCISSGGAQPMVILMLVLKSDNL